jgi:hypothetical protein
MVAFYLIGIAIGVWFVLSAVLNWEWYKALIDVQVTETLFGESAARWSFGLGGLALIAACGFYWVKGM